MSLLLLFRSGGPPPTPPPPPPPPEPPIAPAPAVQSPDLVAMVGKVQALIPQTWFTPGQVPIRDAVIAGFGSCFLTLQQAIDYIRQQTRVATATDGWLDLIAYDFFGTNLARKPGQSDSSFRRQIISYLFTHKNTRAAIIAAIENLLGTTPTVIEPQRVTDTEAYDVDLYYDTNGCYGDDAMPLQCFVDITIPESLRIGPPLIVGWDVPGGGWDTPARIEWVGPPSLDPVEVADIYAALDAVRPVTGVIWAKISAAA